MPELMRNTQVQRFKTNSWISLPQQILGRIVADCRKVRCYAFVADESTDIAVKEQISVCVRFVEKKDNGEHYVREDFLSFVNADKGTNSEALTTKFLEALNKDGPPLDEMRAQGYDSASVMSGHVNGVQARIRRQNEKAVYIHCRAHVLNLCIVHSSKLPLIRNIMDTMQEVAWLSSFLLKGCSFLKNNSGTTQPWERRWAGSQSWKCCVRHDGLLGRTAWTSSLHHFR